MRVTKFEHSALVVEEGSRSVVIDPGGFTRALDGLRGVDAVVITHEHADHWTPEQLRGIIAANPDAVVLAPAGTVAALAAEKITAQTIASGETVAVGGFTLAFSGQRHAVIHRSIPLVDNTGVLVNGTLFHPGDALSVPSFPVDVLAMPIGAPWLTIGEAIDFVSEVKAKRVFPIHEQTLSQIGFDLHRQRLETAATETGGTFFVLESGEATPL